MNRSPSRPPQRGGEPTQKLQRRYGGLQFLPFGEVRRGFFFILFFLLSFIACKKDKAPVTPGNISGQTKACPGDSGITYSIALVEGATFYLWTVPDDAKIISGQGSTTIVIAFGIKSGSICVRANNKKEYSEASCLEVTQGGVSNTWCREMNFKGGGRTEGVGFSIGNKGYIGTGANTNAVLQKDFWEYDPSSNTWTQKTDFEGIARFDAVGFSIGNKGYIGTGQVNIGILYLKDFWEYDPLTNDWTRKADCGDTARAYAFAFSIGNKGYVGSGGDGIISSRTDFYEYDPVFDRWARKTDVVPRNVGSGFSIGNKGYLGLGSNGMVSQSGFWEFDPNDSSNGFDVYNNPMGKWTQKATFPGNSRYGATGFSMGNKGYLGSGFDGTNYFNDFYEYDPGIDTWSQITNFSGEKRAYAVGFAIGNNGYFGIGNNADLVPISSFWVYGQ